jgi:hypothetical protein
MIKPPLHSDGAATAAATTASAVRGVEREDVAAGNIHRRVVVAFLEVGSHRVEEGVVESFPRLRHSIVVVG